MTQEQEVYDDQDRRLLSAVAIGLAFDVRIFTERLGQEVARLTRSGLDEQSIIGIINADYATSGRIFGELKNSIKRGVTGGINQAFRRAGDMGGSLRWIAVSKNICSDCKSRAGQVDTRDSWIARGMPGSGWSICREYCYCQLLPEEIDIDSSIKI